VRVEIPPALDGERVDRVVAFLTGVPRTEAADVVRAGRARLGGRVVAKGSQRVTAGLELEVDLPEHGPEVRPDPTVGLPVVHADADVIVVDKPAGLVVHPGAGHRDGTLVHGLLARFPDMAAQPWPDPSRPGLVHRLDKGTSGLLMVARHPAALADLSAQLRVRTVERSYVALVSGVVEGPAGVIDAPLGRSVADPTRVAVRADGRRAVTGYEVLRRWEHGAGATLVRCTLETGRTHQIRVHLAAIGHPVVGDDRYRAAAAGRSLPGSGGPASVPARPFLHAAVLGFRHPGTGARLRFESPLPPDLEAVLDALG
jgi:23S rRNA pseudouridine1911/1915/1917 synthase